MGGTELGQVIAFPRRRVRHRPPFFTRRELGEVMRRVRRLSRGTAGPADLPALLREVRRLVRELREHFRFFDELVEEALKNERGHR